MEIKLEAKGIGSNALLELRDELDQFVSYRFDALYEGAVRLGFNIPADYYAPRRVHIESTRLHERQGLKQAGGHHKTHDEPGELTEEALQATAKDLQRLLDAAGAEITTSLQLVVSG